jgi:hypothetical protein
VVYRLLIFNNSSNSWTFVTGKYFWSFGLWVTRLISSRSWLHKTIWSVLLTINCLRLANSLPIKKLIQRFVSIITLRGWFSGINFASNCFNFFGNSF